ncbi:MAG: glycosyltransferase family 39 protein [Syntrophaceae bacterium]|nr:glycosyltransferase family 39 protein [Syntrophaceae bacterium]
MKSKIFFLFIIPLFLYIFLLPVMPLMEPDEARYSDIPSLMNRTGDYISPHLLHVVYLEKPPLSYWATALSFKIFGENEFSSRLFVALCAWGCIFLVYRMGVFFQDEKTGLYSAGVLSTFLFHSILGKINILDIPLTFFVCLATWGGYRYFTGDCQRKGWLYLLYVSSGLAFLTKGLIGIIFPLAIVMLWLFISKRWRDVLRLFSPGGISLFLLISCPWVILVQKANKDFFWFFFVHEHFLRYTATNGSRNHPFWFYFPVVLFGTLPWSAFLWKALKERVGEKASLFKVEEKNFLLIWIFFILIFFFFSSSKLIPYIAPIFLPIAVIFGHIFRLYEDRNISMEKGRGRRFLYDLPIILMSLLFIAGLISACFIRNVSLGAFQINLPFENGWELIILPILFLISMTLLPSLVQRKWGRGWFLAVTILSTLFLVTIHFPISHFLTPYKSAYPVSRAIRMLLHTNQEVYQFNTSLYGIEFYNKIRTPLVGRYGGGELDFGIQQLPPEERSHYFLFYPRFYEFCKEKGEIYCITQGKENVEILKKEISTLEVLWDNGVYYFLRLQV